MNTEGHFCTNCGCGLEHGCVCEMCDMTEEEMREAFASPPCGQCGTNRPANWDEARYSPLQVVFGAPLGWYSGSDGEMCGDCMQRIIRGGRA